jgi:hypothetical protein
VKRLLIFSVLVFAAFAAGPLRITGPAFRQTDGGTPLPPGFTHVPGAVIFFSFQIEGYFPTTDRKVRLSYKLDAVDPEAVPIMESIESVLDTELHEEDKEWKPIVRHEIQIPPIAPSGTYKMLIQVTDDIGKTSAKAEVPFQVRGREVEPSPTLVIRNFRWFRGEEDREPLQKPAYRPGDSVWARFDITGYKFGERNAINVNYGIAVLAPGGKVLWSQEEAAVDQSESFYPKRYVPGVMSINLQPNIRPGEYTIVVTARDLIGNQTHESKHTFTIE